MAKSSTEYVITSDVDGMKAWLADDSDMGYVWSADVRQALFLSKLVAERTVIAIEDNRKAKGKTWPSVITIEEVK